MNSEKDQSSNASASMKTLFAVGAAAFLFMLAIAAPASLVPSIAGFEKAGVAYHSIDGTLWRGKIQKLHYRGVNFGDVDYHIKPLRLLSGRLAADVELSGGSLAGEANVSAGVSGAMNISNAQIIFDLDAATRYALLGEPLSGALRADINEIVFTREGCSKANAQIWTDVLSAPAERFNAGAMELSGGASCRGKNLLIALTGEGEAGEATLNLEVTPALTYLLAARAVPNRDEVRNALRGLGFQPDNGGLAIGARGALNSVGT